MSCKKLCFIVTIFTVKIFNCSSQALPEKKISNDRIQIAFLLDVSGSMDQLILKTKSQFWQMANHVSTGRKKKLKPIVEFAVVIYGMDDEINTVLTDFTSDLDSIAIQLHDIEINGSHEYCWSTISAALEKLHWSSGKKDLKIILIAGNESFNQEKIDSKQVITHAKKLDVVINTIYCSPMNDEISNDWKSAAEESGGSYYSISLNDSVDMKENFLDKTLYDFNTKLNETYIPFGPNGKKSYNRMLLQDKNSRLTGMPFFRERVAFKASETFSNPAWDLLDAIKNDSTVLQRLNEIDCNTLSEFKNKEELKNFLEDKAYTRETYKEVIKLRYDMIMHALGGRKGSHDLDAVIKMIVNKEGKRRGFEFGR